MGSSIITNPKRRMVCGITYTTLGTYKNWGIGVMWEDGGGWGNAKEGHSIQYGDKKRGDESDGTLQGKQLVIEVFIEPPQNIYPFFYL